MVVTLIQSLLKFVRWSDVTLVVTKLDEQSVLLLDFETASEKVVENLRCGGRR